MLSATARNFGTCSNVSMAADEGKLGSEYSLYSCGHLVLPHSRLTVLDVTECMQFRKLELQPHRSFDATSNPIAYVSSSAVEVQEGIPTASQSLRPARHATRCIIETARASSTELSVWFYDNWNSDCFRALKVCQNCNSAQPPCQSN